MDFATYLNAVRATYVSGQATEHSYRPALQALFVSIGPNISAINEPRRVACGAPDFVIRVGDIDIGHCEAKDIDIDLKALRDANLEQKARYLKGLPNLVYTNGLDFEFYKSGELVRFFSIGALSHGGIQFEPDSFAALATQFVDFAAERPQTITTAKRLAEMMAGKAALIKDIMGRALVADFQADRLSELRNQYEAFKTHLIHDITVADFADLYAETVAYGLFGARLHDTTPGDFSRARALELLPKSNPFLRSLFGYIAGVDLDDRVRWVIDELCDVFRAADLHGILADFGRFTGRDDPFIHFYETFLSEYNPAKRKSRGVWYTPEPVVNFIVRAVDDVLKAEFGLADGLADTSKITVDWETGQLDKKGRRETNKKQVHRVQILDPATGTGTFLAEVIKQVADRVKGQAEGIWSSYVEQDLIPRVHGFELLMASYAMCHTKLDMVLTELGYKPGANPPRLNIYLTNSLEEGEAIDQSLPFARWLSEEAKGANTIKRDVPIMCVIGNPPYSGHSSNKGTWIEGLMANYKVSPELRRPAQAKWLSDDYVKFIRLAEYMISKNGEGVLGFITNHGYLDNPTFLDMRQHLMRTFDSVHVLDLHGNAKKREVSPDGSPDKNVFDIQQGVAIVVAVRKRTGSQAKLPARVWHDQFWGTRESKYERLWTTSLTSDDFVDVTPTTSPWRFVPSGGDLEAAYRRGPSLADLLSLNGTPAPGFATQHDEFAISFSQEEAVEKVERLLATDSERQARELFRLCAQDQWGYSRAKLELSNIDWKSDLTPVAYRPFDSRWTVFNRNVAVHRRERVSRHMLKHENYALCLSGNSESIGSPTFDAVSIVDHVTELNYFRRGGAYVFPLYLYAEEGTLEVGHRVNFDPKLYAAICDRAGLTGADSDVLSVFDYIYGVLHSPNYRRTYAQFLKVNFPHIPYPNSPEMFEHVAEKGAQLRRLHLMESVAIGETPYPFKGEGSGEVRKFAHTDTGRVYINNRQWFENVPAAAWAFHVGGYEPAQKWLKDRKGRTLNFDDVRHYQRIIKVLVETDRIMGEIELPLGDA